MFEGHQPLCKTLSKTIAACLYPVFKTVLLCFAQANVSVNFIFLIIGLLVSSAVPPLAFMLTWPAVPRGAAIAAALGGQFCAIIAWLVHTKIVYADVTVDTSQNLPPTMVRAPRGCPCMILIWHCGAAPGTP